MTGPLMIDDYEMDLIIYALDDYLEATHKLMNAMENPISKRLLDNEAKAVTDLVVRLKNQQADEAADYVNRTLGHEIPANKDPF